MSRRTSRKRTSRRRSRTSRRRTSRRPRRNRTSRRLTERQVERDFKRLVNMTPAQIRRWAKDPRSKLASLPHIRRELALLARTRATPPSRWTPAMRDKARRTVGFIKRHEAQMRAQGKRYGTGVHATPKRVIALLNWGRRPPRVRVQKVLAGL